MSHHQVPPALALALALAPAPERAAALQHSVIVALSVPPELAVGHLQTFLLRQAQAIPRLPEQHGNSLVSNVAAVEDVGVSVGEGEVEAEAEGEVQVEVALQGPDRQRMRMRNMYR